ncbi:MAG TPA: LodA/GoxA family CTQ-dependent oxidase [Polyangiaceae bacterium]|nr:LodA/GoxA family CTQ-dependent oxidase [Polyangiaceae bacterium]
MAYKVHPGIGVARVGDSTTDWFIGPETRAEPVPPYGGYRDADGRIKRQAARFRVFDHSGGGATPVDSLLVTWTVLLGPDPTGPSLTLTGPNQVAKFAEVPFSGTPSQVSWGEIRTDSQGNLLVLGGVVEGSFYGSSCGRISASVGATPAVRSWVAILPPNFSPSVRPAISVYDYLIELAGVPSPLLFLRDIYPVLKVIGISDAALPAGSAADQALATGASVWSIGSACNGDRILTSSKSILTEWVAGASHYTVEAWPPPPPSVDDFEELDRGPLSRVAFGGWDLGSGPMASQSILDPLTFLSASGDPLRLDLSAPDAYPANFDGSHDWLTDDCTAEWPEIWGTAGALSAFTPNPWETRGFVVRQAGAPAYVEDLLGAPLALVPFVMLLTRTLEFGDVRLSTTQQETAAIIFEVGHQSSGVTFNLTLPSWLSGPATYSVPIQAAGVITTERISITYAPTAIADQNDVITVQQVGGPLFSIPVHARTVAADATEVVFVLDYSLSMNELCADGLQKIVKLRQSLDTFIALTQPSDGVGAVAFNHGLVGTLAMTAPDSSLHDFAALHAPSGSTSIGTGIETAVGVFTGAFSATRQAMIVITDGMENVHPFVNEVMGLIPDPMRIFSIGIGRTQDVNTDVLQALTGNQGGYLLLTGSMTASIETLVLDKFLLRILANATNVDVILDPPTSIYPGKIERIAFPVNEFDHSIDAIVLSREQEAIAFALEAPDGTLVTPETLAGWPGNRYGTATNAAFYRVRMPLPLLNAPSVATGTWHVLLGLRRPKEQQISEEFKRLLPNTRSRVAGNQTKGRPVACEVVVHTDSDLHLDATLQQASIELGSAVLMEVLLNVKQQAFLGEVRAVANVTGPTGFTFTIQLVAQGAGRFVGRFEPVRPGIYRVAMVCEGTTPRGHAFRREQLATAAVLDTKGGIPATPLPGGNGDPGGTSPGTGGNNPCDSPCPQPAPHCPLCKLLCCLRSDPPERRTPRRCALCSLAAARAKKRNSPSC